MLRVGGQVFHFLKCSAANGRGRFAKLYPEHPEKVLRIRKPDICGNVRNFVIGRTQQFKGLVQPDSADKTAGRLPGEGFYFSKYLYPGIVDDFSQVVDADFILQALFHDVADFEQKRILVILAPGSNFVLQGTEGGRRQIVGKHKIFPKVRMKRCFH